VNEARELDSALTTSTVTQLTLQQNQIKLAATDHVPAGEEVREPGSPECQGFVRFPSSYGVWCDECSLVFDKESSLAQDSITKYHR